MHMLQRRFRKRIPKIGAFLLVLLDFLNVLRIQHALSRPVAPEHPVNAIQSQKIFIASTHWNNEYVLRNYWNIALLLLIEHLGPSNVYVSVYESGSWDDSKGALRELDSLLAGYNVNRTVVLDETTHNDEIAKTPGPTGWIDTPRGKRELRRIPYLSNLRNLSLKPLENLAEQGVRFDKILFLNDVVFSTENVMTLLNTNQGSYAAACALDFAKPPKYYDTFALRDAGGNEPIMQVWPYFGSSKSRSALKSGKPIPVESCWNGMVFMDAVPFYPSTSRSSPLRFRGIDDSLATYHLEGSECCLIHADNFLTTEKGVWLNPDVRVGYNGQAYDAVNPHRVAWLSLREIYVGLWKNRLNRWWPVNWIRHWFINRTVDRRLRMWEKEKSGRSEVGRHCLINEMQVLVGNGWAHV